MLIKILIHQAPDHLLGSPQLSSPSHGQSPFPSVALQQNQNGFVPIPLGDVLLNTVQMPTLIEQLCSVGEVRDWTLL